MENSSPGKITRDERFGYALGFLLVVFVYSQAGLTILDRMLADMSFPVYTTEDWLRASDTDRIKINKNWNSYETPAQLGKKQTDSGQDQKWNTGERIFKLWVCLYVAWWALVFFSGVCVFFLIRSRLKKSGRADQGRFKIYHDHLLPTLLFFLTLITTAGIFLVGSASFWPSCIWLFAIAGYLLILGVCLDIYVLADDRLPALIETVNLNRFHLIFVVFLIVLFRLDSGIDVGRQYIYSNRLPYAFLAMILLAVYFWIHGRNFIELYPAADGTSAFFRKWIPRFFAFLVVLLFGVFLLRAALPVYFFPPDEGNDSTAWKVLVVGLLVPPVFLGVFFVLIERYGTSWKRPAVLRPIFFSITWTLVLGGTIWIWVSPVTAPQLLGNLGVLVLFMIFSGLLLYAIEWIALAVHRGDCSWNLARKAGVLVNGLHAVFQRLGYRRVPVLTVLGVWLLVVSVAFPNSPADTVRFRHNSETVVQYSLAELWCRWLTANDLPQDGETKKTNEPCGVDKPKQKTGRYPLIFITSAGGGIRAAYWTMLVMNYLTREETIAWDGRGKEIFEPRIDTKTIFALSGVSGGSVGFLAWAALEKECSKLNSKPTWCAEPNEAARVLGDDYLSPNIAALLFRDLPHMFIPVLPIDDRATILEKAWESSWNGQGICEGQDCGMAGSFADLWGKGVGAGYTPLIISNGAEVLRGTHLNVSVLDANRFEDTTEEVIKENSNEMELIVQLINTLENLQKILKNGAVNKNNLETELEGIIDSTNQITENEFADSFEERFRNVKNSRNSEYIKKSKEFLIFIREKLRVDEESKEIFAHSTDFFGCRKAQADINISTAALLSARFPYISPTGNLVCNASSKQIVDGGYFENSGASPTMELFLALENKIRRYNLQKHGHYIVPIHIHIGNDYEESTPERETPRFLSQWSGPLLALLGGREYETTRALEIVRRGFDCNLLVDTDGNLPSRFLSFNTISNPGPRAPLSWLLSPVARKELEQQLKLQEKKELRNDYLRTMTSVLEGCPFPRKN